MNWVVPMVYEIDIDCERGNHTKVNSKHYYITYALNVREQNTLRNRLFF